MPKAASPFSVWPQVWHFRGSLVIALPAAGAPLLRPSKRFTSDTRRWGGKTDSSSSAVSSRDGTDGNGDVSTSGSDVYSSRNGGCYADTPPSATASTNDSQPGWYRESRGGDTTVASSSLSATRQRINGTFKYDAAAEMAADMAVPKFNIPPPPPPAVRREEDWGPPPESNAFDFFRPPPPPPIESPPRLFRLLLNTSRRRRRRCRVPRLSSSPRIASQPAPRERSRPGTRAKIRVGSKNWPSPRQLWLCPAITSNTTQVTRTQVTPPLTKPLWRVLVCTCGGSVPVSLRAARTAAGTI